MIASVIREICVCLVLLALLAGVGLWAAGDRGYALVDRIVDHVLAETTRPETTPEAEPPEPAPIDTAAAERLPAEPRTSLAPAIVDAQVQRTLFQDAPAAPAPVDIKITAVTQTIDSRQLAWVPDSSTSIQLLSATDTVVLGGTPGVVVTLELPDAKKTSITGSKNGDAWTLTVPTPPAGTWKFTANGRELLVDVKLPSANSPIRVTQVSNNEFRPPQPKPATLNLYGSYVKLRGEQYVPGSKFELFVFAKDGSGDTFRKQPAFQVPNPIAGLKGAWDLDLELPLPLERDLDGCILAVSKSSTDYTVTPAKDIVFFHVAATTNDIPPPPAPKLATPTGCQAPTPNAQGICLLGKRKFFVKTAVPPADQAVVFFVDGAAPMVAGPAPEGVAAENSTLYAEVAVASDGPHQVTSAIVVGNMIGAASVPLSVVVGTTGPGFDRVEPVNLAQAAVGEDYKIAIRFSASPKIVAPTAASLSGKVALVSSDGTATPKTGDEAFEFDAAENTLILNYSDIKAGDYTLTIKKDAIIDEFGNKLAVDITERLFMPVGGDLPTVTPGIPGPTGPYVAFPEWTKPRPIIDGFNPSDKVETRVARLYYYRDAHRVAQIVNRNVRSYNRAAVDMQRQLADKARTIAQQATADRQAKERNAIAAATASREQEQKVESLRHALANSEAGTITAVRQGQQFDEQLDAPGLSDEDRAALKKKQDDLNADVDKREALNKQLRQQIVTADAGLQQARGLEAETNEGWQQSIAVEDQAKDEQFRREVAAATADPDTYAPGVPESDDPVQQVSVSVIGEGIIQLRGPIKGINTIRLMINQIDTPVGQVRIGVHTVQINGEHGDRMEEVAGRIQTYIDHSRFLTVQSAEMLRKAITAVASRQAYRCGQIAGFTQQERDEKYLYAFFGDDFVRELESLDSEFLHTGNKLLSLHSMDSTSLPAALFLLALAKNSTRTEILDEFYTMLRRQLPAAELNYFKAGTTLPLNCEAARASRDEKYQVLACNARFQSLMGFFNADLLGEDTMSPLQREFIRLAQIFKSRLVVEMEYNQRVHERAMIEERLGNRQEDLETARKKEKEAKAKQEEARKALNAARASVGRTVKVLRERLAEIARLHEVVLADVRTAQSLNDKLVMDFTNAFVRSAEKITGTLAAEKAAAARTELRKVTERVMNAPFTEEDTFGKRLDRLAKDLVEKWSAVVRQIKKITFDGVPLVVDGHSFKLFVTDGKVQFSEGAEGIPKPLVHRAVATASEIRRLSQTFAFEEADPEKWAQANRLLSKIETDDKLDMWTKYFMARTMMNLYKVCIAQYKERIDNAIQPVLHDVDNLSVSLNSIDADFEKPFARWLALEDRLRKGVPRELLRQLEPQIEDANVSFRAAMQAALEVAIATREASDARQPLDHKKLMDMLIDDLEDKYIELLEGTRAHTANIDGYIKRLATALDDDFNTQFYYPAFRHVRSASRMWDVNLGQVETTTILANNRGFAKVEPQATMEFDLPKRDILINEAMNGAKAAINDFGALVQDPAFLSLSKLNAGQSTASPAPGATGGLSTVRDVLPGLSTDTAEDVLGQHGPGNPQFGTALDALIPDPAVYKFETGTGFEIRPVIEPDGQSVVFNFNYMYTTNVREPVRADEKHLGRVKRHYIHTDVQLGNYELREVSRYVVALKASRTSRGVPLLEDIPVAGVLFRPLPSAESSLQENIILAQATVFPTLFDLMGLRWAPAVADLDPLRLEGEEFVVRGRDRVLQNRVFDYSSSQVDQFLRIPEAERRTDLYRSQETVPAQHPNGYRGPGLNLRDSELEEGSNPDRPPTQFVPGTSNEGSPLLRRREPVSEEIPPGAIEIHDGPLMPTSKSRSSRPSVANREVVPVRHVEPVRKGSPGMAKSQRETPRDSLRRAKAPVPPEPAPKPKPKLQRAVQSVGRKLGLVRDSKPTSEALNPDSARQRPVLLKWVSEKEP